MDHPAETPVPEENVTGSTPSVGTTGPTREAPDAIGHTEASTIFHEGDILNRYRVLRLIGTGGMSEVYLAERTDAPDQKVALKVLRLVDGGFLRRFEREQAILAKLNHPLIARFYDVGTASTGHPWLVMEYVDGLPVTTYCDKHRFSVRQRLALFGEICKAVSFAHQHLVIHRDIKPDNVMIDGNGVPKLLDFGISAVMNPETGNQATVTQFGSRLMTPDYASPEQWRGERLTAASDVYSLGVLLFKLLAGTLPFYLSRMPMPAAFKVLEDKEAPSLHHHLSRQLADPGAIAADRQVDPARLRRLLRGEPSQIVAKALCKEPLERYESVEAMADDVRRYLTGYAIRARPQSWLYRGGKFFRRNRLVMSFTVLIFVILSVSLAAVWQEQRRTEAARLLAERERASAEKISEYLASLFDMADPRTPQGRALTARELLDIGRQKLSAEGAANDYVQARLKLQMGKTYISLGEFGTALALFNEAVAVFESEQRPAYFAEALLSKGHALHGLNRQDDLRKIADKALAYCTSELPDSVLLAGAFGLQGQTFMLEGSAESGVAWLKKSVNLWIRHEGEDADALPPIYHQLGVGSHLLGDLAAAEDYYQRAIAVAAKQITTRRGVFLIYQEGLAAVYRDRGRHDRAVALVEQVIVGTVEVYGDNSRRHLRALSLKGQIYEVDSQFRPAEVVYRDVVARYEARGEEDTRRYGDALDDLGRLLSTNGVADEAETILRRALSINQNLFGEVHQVVARRQMLLGLHLVDQRRFDEAKPLLDKALNTYLNLEGGFYSEVGSTYSALSEVAIAAARWEQAYTYSLKGKTFWLKRFDPKSDYGLLGRDQHLRILIRTGRFAEALAGARQVLIDQTEDRSPWRSVLSEALVAKIQLRQGHYAAATAGFAQAKQKVDALTPEGNALFLIYFTIDHGAMLLEGGLFREALGEYQRAFDQIDALETNNTLLRNDCHADVAALHAYAGQWKKAEDHLAELRSYVVASEDQPYALRLQEMEATLAYGKGDLAKAAAKLEALIEKRLPMGSSHFQLIRNLSSLAEVQIARGELDEAERRLSEADEKNKEEPPEDSMYVAHRRLLRAEIRVRRGEVNVAREDLKKALTVLTGNLPEGHPFLLRAARIQTHLDVLSGEADDFEQRRAQQGKQLDTLYGSDTFWVTQAEQHWRLMARIKNQDVSH